MSAALHEFVELRLDRHNKMTRAICERTRRQRLAIGLGGGIMGQPEGGSRRVEILVNF